MTEKKQPATKVPLNEGYQPNKLEKGYKPQGRPIIDLGRIKKPGPTGVKKPGPVAAKKPPKP